MFGVQTARKQNVPILAGGSKFLQIMLKLKCGTILFGDFHKESLMHSIDNTHNENDLSACKYKSKTEN